MSASYPASLKTFTTKQNLIDVYDASHIDDIQDETTAIETELGTDVAGDQTNLKTRLGYCLEDNGSFKHGTSFPGSPRTGDWFYRTDLNVAYVYTGSTWLAQSGITSYAAGDYLIAGPSRFTNMNSVTTYTKIAELYLPRGGTLRIKFSLGNNDGGVTAYGRIYRNGSAVGTERTTGASPLIDQSEDISGWAAGDLLQLYAKVSASSGSQQAGGLKVYENAPSTEIFNTGGIGKGSGPLTYYGSTAPSTLLNTLGSIGDFYIYDGGGASTTLYVKTGASTWTAK